MKSNSFHKTKAGLLLAFTMALASCQHQDVVMPEKADEAQSALREAAIPTTPKKHQLVKHGARTLTYSEDGNLRKVIYSVGGRGSKSLYTNYFYSENKVISKQYYNDNLAETITYLLDAAGRCYESQHVEMMPLGTNIFQEIKSSYSYTYNTKGQLLTRKDNKTPDRYTALNYDTAGNLVKVSFYTFSYDTVGPALLGETSLTYQPMGGDPLLRDFSPLNCEAANLPDRYLRVFGKQPIYLVSMFTENSVQGGKIFSYTMNEDGYPTSRKAYNIKGAALAETIDYEYLVTDIGLK